MLKRIALIGIGLSMWLSTPVATQAQKKESKPAALTALDYFEIQQLVNRYAFAIDTCSNNGYDYADLYTPDGVFYWGVGARKSVGREQLAEAAGGGKNGCQKLDARHAREADRDARDGQSRHRAVTRWRDREVVPRVSRRAGNRRGSRSLRTRRRISGRLREDAAGMALQVAAPRLSPAGAGNGESRRRGAPARGRLSSRTPARPEGRATTPDVGDGLQTVPPYPRYNPMRDNAGDHACASRVHGRPVARVRELDCGAGWRSGGSIAGAIDPRSPGLPAASSIGTASPVTTSA